MPWGGLDTHAALPSQAPNPARESPASVASRRPEATDVANSHRQGGVGNGADTTRADR